MLCKWFKLMSTNNKYRMTDAQKLEGRSRSKKVGLSEEKTMVEEMDRHEFWCWELHMLITGMMIYSEDFAPAAVRHVVSLVFAPQCRILEPAVFSFSFPTQESKNHSALSVRLKHKNRAGRKDATERLKLRYKLANSGLHNKSHPV